MFRLKSHDDDEAHDDVSTLLKKIRGIQAPENDFAKPVVAPPPEKKPGGEESDAGSAGDFSALIKKLGVNTIGTPFGAGAEPAPSGDTVPSGEPPLQGEKPDGFDDLFEDLPPSKPVPVSPVLRSDDVRAALGKIMEQTEPAPTVSTPPGEKPAQPKAEPPREQTVEIIEENPRAHRASDFFKKKKAAKGGTEPSSAENIEVSDTDERIISADQISEFSGLILPKGATFQIDEINLHGRVNAFGSTGTGTLPPETC